MPILPYILRKEQRFGTKLSRIRLIITLFAILRHHPVVLQILTLPFFSDPYRYPDVPITIINYETCIESTKRLIYFIIENNVTPLSSPWQIYHFNLS
jgi:hypothetical protein